MQTTHLRDPRPLAQTESAALESRDIRVGGTLLVGGACRYLNIEKATHGLGNESKKAKAQCPVRERRLSHEQVESTERAHELSVLSKLVYGIVSGRGVCSYNQQKNKPYVPPIPEALQ